MSGFFIQVAPGVDYVFNSFKDAEETRKANDIVPSVGIGVGIGIIEAGISWSASAHCNGFLNC